MTHTISPENRELELGIQQKINECLDNFESFCMRPNIRIFKNGDYEIKPFDICLADRQALNITVVDYAK